MTDTTDAEFLHREAPKRGDITPCFRCEGTGGMGQPCGHCAGSGRLRWLAYGKSEPAETGSHEETLRAALAHPNRPSRLPDRDVMRSLTVFAGGLNRLDMRLSCGTMAGDAILALIAFAESRA